MKKILIIGANGFVGNYLIKEFLNNNYHVIACDIADTQSKIEDVEYCTLDILDEQKVNSVIKEQMPDYIVNLAAISSVGLSWKIPKKTVEVNLIGTINILEAVKSNCPSCKVLLIGSSEEYKPKNEPLNEKDPINGNNPYGISKIAQEYFARMYRENDNLNIVCTRSFNHTGIGQPEQFVIASFCKQIAEIDKKGIPGEIHVGNLSAYRDISDVRDIVKVYRHLLENETEDLVYNVGSGKAHKIEDILKYIISLSNTPVEIVIDKEKFRPVDMPYTCCDNTKVKEYFDGTDIRDTIKEMYEYFKNQ